jgi:hypothetical protein
MKLNYLCFIVLLLEASFVQAQFTDVINSNRPGKSQSAFAVGKNVFQIESGLYTFNEKHDLMATESTGFGTDLSLRYGFMKEELELILDLQYQGDQFKTILGNENRKGFKQITVGGKYLFYDPNKNYVAPKNFHSWKAKYKFKWREFIPSIAGYAGFNLRINNPYTFKSDERISPKVALITQNQFTGGIVVVINVIADKFTTDFPTYGYILTITKGFNEKWSGFVENQGFKSDYYADAILRGGAAYLIKDNIQIDASLTSNFKDTPSVFYGAFGISWRFDANYTPVLLKIDNKKNKDKKKQDKKEKKKKKKSKKIKALQL